MPTKYILMCGALVLGAVFASPAFSQEPRTCIRMQLGCSDAPYPVTEGAVRLSHRRLYNMVPPRVMPQQSAVQPCIHAQTSCL